MVPPRETNQGEVFRFRLDAHLKRRLQEAAIRDNVSVAAFVNRARSRALAHERIEAEQLAQLADALLQKRAEQIVKREADLNRSGVLGQLNEPAP